MEKLSCNCCKDITFLIIIKLKLSNNLPFFQIYFTGTPHQISKDFSVLTFRLLITGNILLLYYRLNLHLIQQILLVTLNGTGFL